MPGPSITGVKQMKSKILTAILLCLAFGLRLTAQPAASGTNSNRREQPSSQSYDYAMGVRIYREWTVSHPESSTAWTSLGQCLYAVNKFDEAARCCERAVSLDPSNAGAYQWAGYSRYMLNEYKSAVPWLRQYTHLKPGELDGHRFLAYCLAQTGQIGESGREFNDTARIDPSLGSGNDQLAYCLTQIYRWSEALPYLEKSLAVNGQNTNALLCLGICQLRLKNYSSATNNFNKYIAVAPDTADGFFWLGTALCELMQYAQAVSSFERAVENRPGNGLAHAWLGYALLGAMRFSEAVTELETAHQLEPDNAGVTMRLLNCYIWAGEPIKVWVLFPKTAGLVMTLILVLFALGSTLLFKASFRQTAETAPGLGFSIGWAAYYWDSQLTFILLTGLSSSVASSSGLAPGICFGLIPLLTAGLFAFPMKNWGEPFRWPRPFPWTLLVAGCVGMIAVYFADAFYMMLIPPLLHIPLVQPKNVAMIQQMVKMSPLLGVMVVVVLAPLAEEILFRGLLFGALLERFGKSTIFITALFFAAVHFDVLYFVPLAAIGALLGWLRWKSGSIWLSYPFHLLTNAVAVAYHCRWLFNR